MKPLLIVLACASLSGCPAPRYYFYLSPSKAIGVSKSLKGRWEFGPKKVSYEITCGSQWPPSAFVRIKNHSEEPLKLNVSSAKLTSGTSLVSLASAETEISKVAEHELLLPLRKRTWVALRFTDSSGTFTTKGELTVSLGVITDVDGKPLHTIPDFLTVGGQVYSSY